MTGNDHEAAYEAYTREHMKQSGVIATWHGIPFEEAIRDGDCKWEYAVEGILQRSYGWLLNNARIADIKSTIRNDWQRSQERPIAFVSAEPVSVVGVEPILTTYDHYAIAAMTALITRGDHQYANQATNLAAEYARNMMASRVGHV